MKDGTRGCKEKRIWWEEALDQREETKRRRGCSWKKQSGCWEKEAWRGKKRAGKERIFVKAKRENESWVWREKVIERIGWNSKVVAWGRTKARAISYEAKRWILHLAT